MNLHLLNFLSLIAGALGIYESYRLPDAIRPNHYDLRVLTHLDGPDQLRFEGQVKIDLIVLEETRNITLHAKNLTINESQIVLNSQDRNNCVAKIELDELREFYIMHLCEPLQRSGHYQLTLPFKSPLNANDTGYYRSSYNVTGINQTQYLAVTQFSPTFARLAFPCFDEPHLKSTFRVTLGYHRNYTGYSNTPVHKCEAHESLDNYIWCDYEPLFRTSTYLVAYAVHNLTNVASSVSLRGRNVTFNSWMQPDVVQYGNFSVHFAPRALQYLEKLFEFSFPLGKIDQLALPTHKFSAMENWGLVTFVQGRFIHNDSVEVHASKEQKASTIAHEYAHQWFGNLVTMKWWNNLWLKEGPSTYFAYLTLDALLPEWNSAERSIGNDLAIFFRQDAINNTIAISRDVQDPKSILEQFSEYAYKKGSLTMRMLHKMLGDEIFFAGIRSFVHRHVYDNVDQSDLWLAMQEAADEKDGLPDKIILSTVLDSWTLQEGYPLVTVHRNYATGSVAINQTRFWLSSAQRENCWWIPLNVVSQQEANFEETRPQFWLECPQSELSLQLPHKAKSDEWIMLNPQVNTIYRVNYDEPNWRLIIQTLNTTEEFGGIHVLNRAQLLDDIMAMAWTNHQSYELALSMLEYLPRERKYLPWKRVFHILSNHGAQLTGESVKIFEDYMKILIKPIYESCPKLDSMQLNKLQTESLALCHLAYAQACRYGLKDCIQQAVSLTRSNDDAKVPVDFQDIIYCANVRHGNNEQFQLMRQLFEKTTKDPKQGTWARALGCTRNFTQLQPFLDYLLTESTKNSFYIETVNSALRFRNTSLETGNHILQNAKLLNEKLSARNIKDLPLTRIFNRRSLKEIDEHMMGLSKFEQPLKRALEMHHVNLKWIQVNSNDFIQALGKYV